MYFVDKVLDEMDKLWIEKGWINEIMDNWLEDKEGL